MAAAATLLRLLARLDAERDADAPDYGGAGISADEWRELDAGASLRSMHAAIAFAWCVGSVARARRRRDIKRRARRMLYACGGPVLTPASERLRAGLRQIELTPARRAAE